MTERGEVRAVDGVSFSLQRGQTIGVVGGVRFGQDDAGQVDHGPAPGRSRRALGQRPPRRRRDHRPLPQADAQGVGHRDVDGPPGPDDVAQSGSPCRGPDHGAPASPPAPRPKGGSRDRRRALSSVRIPIRRSGCASTPTSSRGECASGWSSPAALACGPRLLFADEPTTALDVTVQAQILGVLKQMQRDRHMAMVLVHPRSRGRRRLHGRDHRDVRRPGGRAGADGGALHPDADAVHPGPAGVDPLDETIRCTPASPSSPVAHRT